MKTVDYSVYLVTDNELMSTDTIEECVEEAIKGGVTVVQLREKEACSLDFFNKAASVKKICDKYNVSLIINDRIDIALAVKADGVHIGQSDVPAKVARSIIGDDMILGVSVSTVKESIQAKNDGADYLGVGAMFATGTKTDAKIVTKETLIDICNTVNLPIVIIGGINERTIQQFSDCPIDGVAVVSAIVAKKDICKASREIKELFFENRRRVIRNKNVALFDLDGTIFDSLDVWVSVDNEFFNKRGIDVPSDFFDVTCAMSFVDTAQYVIKRFGLPDTVESLIEEWQQMAFYEYANNVKLKPYAYDYIKELANKGIELVVVTCLDKEIVSAVLKNNAVDVFFKHIFSVADVKCGKTDGKIYEYVLKELNVSVSQVVVFEDTLEAIIGAKSNGLMVVAVEDRQWLAQKNDIVRNADMYVVDFSLAPIFC